jgi:hypothetical protein
MFRFQMYCNTSMFRNNIQLISIPNNKEAKFLIIFCLSIFFSRFLSLKLPDNASRLIYNPRLYDFLV